MATTAPGSAPAIKPAGPAWSQNFSSRAVSSDANFVIRAATSADEPYLLPMMRALAEKEPNPNPDAFREALISKAFRYLLEHPERGRLWALIADERLVGYIVLTLGFSFEFLGTDAFID